MVAVCVDIAQFPRLECMLQVWSMALSMRLQRHMLGPTYSREPAMTSVSGKTANGFTYEGDYEQASSGRITWTATYRRGGDFFGMRHGRINQLPDTPMADVGAVVMSDIESTWVQSS